MARIEHYDDPLNPHGWGLEPAIRRLRMAFPDLSWTFNPTVLVGSWEEFEGPEFENGRQGAAATCAQVSERSNMPIDEYLWFEDPPSSSTVACQAIATAADQGHTVVQRVLRALREATFIGRTNVSEPEALDRVLSSVPEVDTQAILAALEDGTAEAALSSHRRSARELDVDGVQQVGDRPRLPTVVVRGEDEAKGISGRRRYGSYRGIVRDVIGLEPEENRPSVEDVLDRFSREGWVSTTELSLLVGEPYDAVRTRAEELAATNEAIERSFASESFWRRPGSVEDPRGDTTEGDE